MITLWLSGKRKEPVCSAEIQDKDSSPPELLASMSPANRQSIWQGGLIESELASFIKVYQPRGLQVCYQAIYQVPDHEKYQNY